MKKVIVLGATGQLGAETATDLCRKGYRILAVGHRASDNGFFQQHNAGYLGNFSLENPADFERLPDDADAVVHLAGTMPAHSGCSPMPYIQSIVVGMVNLCEWMKQRKVRRIIFNTTPSDIAQHFASATPAEEDADRSFPQDGGDHAIYAIAKNAAVDILSYYQQAEGFLPCIFRHMTVYGWHPNAAYYLNGEKKYSPTGRSSESVSRASRLKCGASRQEKKSFST